MKKIVITGLAIVLWSCHLFAGEGMWLPILLKQYNEKDMQAAGLKLSADDIYNINKSSLKDAIVSLGGFCTAEIVSQEGLLFTNHHCGYDAIAEHSTPGEHDYLKNGFWAKSKDEELQNSGLTASILVYMKDVTSIIMDAAGKIKNEEMRQLKISTLRDSLEKAEPNENHYTIQVRSFFKGNEFYLLAYEVFKDVRLVGAPPASIGKFGGDQDNWMWPRHTGDFSIFRIYTGADGKPAEYNKGNIPYKPKHFLSISLKGVKKNDYTMILGFPGTTNRYITSNEFESAASVQNPAAIEAMETQINIMKADMDADRKTALALASDFASTSNTYKYYLGQERQLKQLNYIDLEKEKETGFMAWVDKDEERKKKYGEIFNDIKAADEKLKSIEPAYSYITYGFFGSTIAQYGFTYYGLYKSLPEKAIKNVNVDSLTAPVRDKLDEYFSKEIAATDKKVLAAELYLIYSRLPKIKLPDFLLKEVEKYNANDPKSAINSYVDYIYKKSALVSRERAEAFLQKPSPRKFEKDPFFALLLNMINYYYAELSSTSNSVNKILTENHRLYIQGLREWQSNKKFYPDANSTLRVTYGSVQPYYPRDALFYNYYTTYTGILEKYNPQDPEFDVPARELELLRAKKFGRYAQNDTLRINFLTTTDITGGNSGSPVMDGQGRLVGLAFDGDWESMIGDLYVDPKLNRTIAVDIRYVLWVIDVYAGADNIMKELKIE